MKTKIIISVVALSLVLITKSVFAQNESITGIQKKEVQATASQVKEEKKSVLSELKIKNSTAIYNAIKMGLTKRYAALEKIKAKLEARIGKNPMKKDPTEAVAKLEEFDAIIINYNLHLANFDAKFTSITASETTTKFSQLVAELKVAANVVKKDLNDMQKILRDAVVALAQAPKLEVTKTE